MKLEVYNLAIRILDQHRIMTLATNREDGWPQATIVGYANDGLKLYCLVARTGQKYANVTRDPRVSAAIGNDFSDPLQISGLSLAGRAMPVCDKIEFDTACDLFLRRFPEYASWRRPDPAVAPILRITPMVISVIDYSKGFGHSELADVSESDFKVIAGPTFQDWFGRL